MEPGSSCQENSLPAPQNEHSRSPFLGRAQISFGYFLIIVGGIIGLLGFGGLRPGPDKEWWVYLVGAALALVAACVLPLATTMIRRGRQHLTLILPLTSAPADKFVLYLRAFTDDSKLTEVKIAQRGAARGSSNVVTVPVARTEEEQIREAVRPFGPLIAVGSPGEPLPKLGARRGYLKHDSWQDTVLAMMQKAQLVLLGAGLSKSPLWEVTQAIANVPPERLVLIIPMDHKEYLQFQERLSRHFPRGLPDYPEGKTIKYPEKIRGAIFTPDWHPFFARFDLASARGNQFRTIESHFAYGLQPVYQQLGAPWPGVQDLPLLPTKVPKAWPLRKQLTRYYLSIALCVLAALAIVILIVLIFFGIVRTIMSG